MCVRCNCMGHEADRLNQHSQSAPPTDAESAVLLSAAMTSCVVRIGSVSGDDRVAAAGADRPHKRKATENEDSCQPVAAQAPRDRGAAPRPGPGGRQPGSRAGGPTAVGRWTAPPAPTPLHPAMNREARPLARGRSSAAAWRQDCVLPQPSPELRLQSFAQRPLATRMKHPLKNHSCNWRSAASFTVTPAFVPCSRTARRLL
jgi:hypothetical protein